MKALKLTLTYIAVISALLFLSTCKTAYVVSDFESRTALHKTVAILPFEMIFSGIKPEQLTDSEVEKIKEARRKLKTTLQQQT